MKSMDSSTVDELRKGSQRAFNLIVKTYQKQLWLYFKQKTGSHEIAEELTNDTFCRLWDYRSKLDTEKSIEALLREIARGRFSKWLEKHEKKKKQMADYLEDYRRHDQHTGGPDALNAQIDMAIIVGRLSLILPEKCCQVFLLSRIHGMSYEEIAQELSISKATVRNHLIKAKKLLSGMGSLWNYP